MYLSGARGTNSDYIYPTNFTGFANNALVAPDSQHILYSGAATSKASMVVGDKMVVATVDRLIAKATMMGGGTTGVPQIQPIMVDGEEHYVLVMTPWDEYNMRASAATAGSWMDIQKAAATAEGRNNPIFKGGLGMINNVILHKHKSVTRFTDYGAGLNVAASRSLFLGTQAAVCAFGSPGTGLRYDWNEETRDNGNQAVITTGTICGMKKTSFTIAGASMDFGVIAVDSAAADPG
jgi:N4-gp56 family major capsid protein